jgi:transcriptional regulator with XRE-family HTH domain
MNITAQNTDAAVLRELGARLRRTRLERNLSQGQLAKEAGVGRMTVQRIEAGESASLRSFVRVLRVLGLLEGIDRLVPEPPPSPIDQLKRRSGQRQRAGSSRSTEQPGHQSPSWHWADERGGREA